ncbi:M20 family metallopeptidase [Streptosporangium roseum]|uniref:Peptidase M20 n=3 Tax=Streptosporangium roseum TaxID=2001 RepID=D2B5M2_STRRD|nr:M20 family metallopeptidase [Streptosporangium roseum]ACZ89527.1 peptidase M20 [Streptosporangium roseum DSM 43021]
MNLRLMLEDLEELVSCESFSADHEAVARSARVVADQGLRRLGTRPETIVIDGVTHLRWTFGTPRVLLVGHHDTVWPIGTLAEHPWSLVDGIARGPGVFDMKAGLVQAFHALAALPSPEGVCLLVTGDEEVGSPSSRALIEESARGCAAAFVLEAGADGGALKTARKGTSNYAVTVHGRAAHAGLEPERGANAGIELAHQILALGAIALSADDGAAPDGLGPTTVTPTVLSGGTTTNTVPALASVEVDVRVPTLAAQARVDEMVRALAPRTPGTRLEVSGGPNRPPLEQASSARLFELACRIAKDLGMEPPRGVAVGGASDGNFTAGIGCPTLDGLGAVGGGAHAAHEHVVVEEMPGRTRLLTGLIASVLGGEPPAGAVATEAAVTGEAAAGRTSPAAGSSATAGESPGEAGR